jgi:hypothetical protein
MNLLKSINKAVKCSNLNDAVFIIQTAIQQTDGFNASIYFADSPGWDRMPVIERKKILSKYIAYELCNK